MKKLIYISLILTFFISCSSSDSLSPLSGSPCDGNCGEIVEANNPSNSSGCIYQANHQWGLGEFYCKHIRIENECSGEIRSFIFNRQYNPWPSSFDTDYYGNYSIGDRICDYQ